MEIKHCSPRESESSHAWGREIAQKSCLTPLARLGALPQAPACHLIRGHVSELC